MLKKIIFIAAFLILSAVSVFANRCEQVTVREEFERSKLAMTVRIESLKKASVRAGEESSIVSAVMIVEKVYKGAYKPGARLRFASLDEYAGGFGFKESDKGRRMLLFKIERVDSFSWLLFAPNKCTRNAFIEEAHEDIAYLDKLDKVAGKSRISGTVYFQGQSGQKLFEGVKIKITGREKTYELMSDTNGVFEIYDLPAGHYVIDAEQRKDLTIGKILTLSEWTYAPFVQRPDFPEVKDYVAAKYRKIISLKPRGHASIQVVYLPR